MRPAVRYVSRFPTPAPAEGYRALARRVRAANAPARVLHEPGGDRGNRRAGRGDHPLRRLRGDPGECSPGPLPAGCRSRAPGRRLSIGAAGLFMRSLTGNPMDVHLHTGANLRRYLLKVEGVSLRNKLLALLTWHTGPEVRSTQHRMEPPPQPDPTAVAALPRRSQAELLDALAESVYSQPATDWSKVTNLGQMRAVPEVKNTVNLAQQYAEPRVRSERADQPSRPDRRARQLHPDARLQAPPGDGSRSFTPPDCPGAGAIS